MHAKVQPIAQVDIADVQPRLPRARQVKLIGGGGVSPIAAAVGAPPLVALHLHPIVPAAQRAYRVRPDVREPVAHDHVRAVDRVGPIGPHLELALRVPQAAHGVHPYLPAEHRLRVHAAVVLLHLLARRGGERPLQRPAPLVAHVAGRRLHLRPRLLLLLHIQTRIAAVPIVVRAGPRPLHALVRAVVALRVEHHRARRAAEQPLAVVDVLHVADGAEGAADPSAEDGQHLRFEGAVVHPFRAFVGRHVFELVRVRRRYRLRRECGGPCDHILRAQGALGRCGRIDVGMFRAAQRPRMRVIHLPRMRVAVHYYASARAPRAVHVHVVGAALRPALVVQAPPPEAQGAGDVGPHEFDLHLVHAFDALGLFAGFGFDVVQAGPFRAQLCAYAIDRSAGNDRNNTIIIIIKVSNIWICNAILLQKIRSNQRRIKLN